jgi:hypothetical protein
MNTLSEEKKVMDKFKKIENILMENIAITKY